MESLKIKTLHDDNIQFVDNYYRFVNHTDRLATTGFKTRLALQNAINAIKFDTKTVEIMQKRYSLLFS